jgi:hypothetical protein
MNFDDAIALVESSLDSKNDFYAAIGEYVGANVPLDIDRWALELSPFKKKSSCYRIWEVSNEEFENLQNTTRPQYGCGFQYETTKKDYAPIKSAKYYACSKDLKSIKAMLSENSFTNVVVTKHVGQVIDILEALRSAIENVDDPELNRMLKNTYTLNKYQNEVLFLDGIEALNQANIVGMSESGDPDEIR